MKRLFASLALVLLAVTASNVAAQLQPGSAAGLPPFSFVDHNGDRYVSEQEAASEAALREQFADIDVNDDDRISRLEYVQSVRHRHEQTHNSD